VVIKEGRIHAQGTLAEVQVTSGHTFISQKVSIKSIFNISNRFLKVISRTNPSGYRSSLLM